MVGVFDVITTVGQDLNVGQIANLMEGKRMSWDIDGIAEIQRPAGVVPPKMQIQRFFVNQRRKRPWHYVDAWVLCFILSKPPLLTLIYINFLDSISDFIHLIIAYQIVRSHARSDECIIYFWCNAFYHGQNSQTRDDFPWCCITVHSQFMAPRVSQ